MLLRVTAVAIISLVSSANGISTNFGISGGRFASPRQFKYHALIGCDDVTVEWICSGVIINNRFVATLASCVYGCNKFKIRVGTAAHKDSNITEGTPGEYDSKPGILPFNAPGFDMGGNENDLALIETSKQIEYSSDVDAVILPALNESTVAPNVQVLAIGFGKRNETNWWMLRYLTLGTITNSECLETFPNLGNTTMCAKGTGSLCGEYGAPLVLNEYGHHFVGIHQASIEPCVRGGPERFVNIGSFIHWIRETARFEKLIK